MLAEIWHLIETDDRAYISAVMALWFVIMCVIAVMAEFVKGLKGGENV